MTCVGCAYKALTLNNFFKLFYHVVMLDQVLGNNCKMFVFICLTCL